MFFHRSKGEHHWNTKRESWVEFASSSFRRLMWSNTIKNLLILFKYICDTFSFCYFLVDSTSWTFKLPCSICFVLYFWQVLLWCYLFSHLKVFCVALHLSSWVLLLHFCCFLLGKSTFCSSYMIVFCCCTWVLHT